MKHSHSFRAVFSGSFVFWELLALLLLMMVACQSGKPDFSQRQVLFDSDWRFQLGDVVGAEQLTFDDNNWRTLDLPHDWGIEDLPANPEKKQIGPFSEDSQGQAATGHVLGGTGWYRKMFTLDPSSEGKKVQVYFDGVYMESDVWINGQHLGFHPYGYTPFLYDLTPYLKPSGEKNTLAVKVNNPGKNSRWYSGSGIYRHVYLNVTNPVHIPVWGVFVTTPEVSPELAKIQAKTTVANDSRDEAELVLTTQVFSPEGLMVGTSEEKTTVAGSGNCVVTQQIQLEKPVLWSLDSPKLYKAVSEVKLKGKTVDRQETTFGIRSLEFSAEKGFLLNGEPLLLKGGCMHHDNGPLGSATIDRAEERRVELMKQFGFNAIRTSHNPPSKQFLEACDRLGVLVIDEAFDQWQRPKNPEDYHQYFNEWHQRDLEAMLLRDRNHPSIIAWSIGNEIPERAEPSGYVIAKELVQIVKNIDSTRPVTEALCDLNRGQKWETTEQSFSVLDIGGYNYLWQLYEPDHEKFPSRIMWGTESVPAEAYENWVMVEKHNYVLGDFVWTAMDYMGESGIGHTWLSNEKQSFLCDWPWFDAYCGDIDLCGFKKPQSHFRDVVWRISKLEVAVHVPIPEGLTEKVSYWGWPDERQSWNWLGLEGKPLIVTIYSAYSEVRLELNGEVIGTKKVSDETRLRAGFEVPYHSGELKVIGMQDGKDVESKVLKTTGVPASIRLTADLQTIRADRNDLAYITVEVVDEEGYLVPDAELPVQFEVNGAGELAAVGNGNPSDMRSFRAPECKTFRGKCLVILRPNTKEGPINLSAKSGNLKAANLKIATN